MVTYGGDQILVRGHSVFVNCAILGTHLCYAYAIQWAASIHSSALYLGQAQWAIRTTLPHLLDSSSCFELSGPTADGASEDSNYLWIRVLKTQLQQHLVESVYEKQTFF